MRSEEMTCESVQISNASASELGEILALLAAVNLPHEGVTEHLSDFLVARGGDGRLLGTVGLERHGSTGLLRSAAVAPEIQHSGVSSCLTAALLERAANDGVEKVVLLTSTARDFFARRFGFSEASRSAYDEPLAASSEWRLPRCSSAVCMSLDLKGQR
jgi:N-acetylglutamate synthase-like GNAT family acetyltransferase